jgi:hypothetical protein
MYVFPPSALSFFSSLFHEFTSQPEEATRPRAYAFVDPELVSASATASNQVDFFFLRAQLTSSLFITHNNLMNFSFLNLCLGCQNFANISKSLSQG